jgi:hypothetical protein
LYVESASWQVHAHVFVEQAVAPADGDRRAGAGAAGPGLPGAAFMDTQPDVAAIHDFHEADIGALREARVVLDRGAEAGNRRSATDGTRITACGLPTETAPIST